MVSRACICGRVIPAEWKRCEACGRQNLRTAVTAQRGYGAAHQRRSRAVIAAYPSCELCGATEDLTADHITAMANGGDPLGPLRVLCRSCNSRRGSTP
jgi:5-methylcytosine-specific restriction endonuclease McrA